MASARPASHLPPPRGTRTRSAATDGHAVVEALTLEVGTALHGAGAPAQHVEAAMTAVAGAWGLEGRFLANPTVLQAAFGPPGAQRHGLTRVEPGEVALGRLAALDALVGRIAGGELRPADARREVRDLVRAAGPWKPAATVWASAVLGAAAAVFFGGDARHAALAAGVGAGVRLLELALARRGDAGRLTGIGGAALGTGLAVTGARLLGLATAWPALLGGIILLAPGYALTVAATELAAGHLVSGTARLTAAATRFLQLVLGIAATASALGAWQSGELGAAPPATGVAPWVAAVAVGLAHTVLLQAAARDALRVTTGATAGYAAFVLARAWSGDLWAPLVAAALVSAISDLEARRSGRPAVLVLVPGILALVPGGMGIGSLSLLLHDASSAGIAAGLATVMAAVALGSGVLVGSLVVRGPGPGEQRPRLPILPR